KNGMRRTPLIARIQFALPPRQQFQCALLLRNLVAQVVRPAAVGIQIVKILVQLLGQQPGNHIEVFVVVRRQPARVRLRLLRRTILRRELPGNVEFTWTQHECAVLNALRQQNKDNGQQQTDNRKQNSGDLPSQLEG